MTQEFEHKAQPFPCCPYCGRIDEDIFKGYDLLSSSYSWVDFHHKCPGCKAPYMLRFCPSKQAGFSTGCVDQVSPDIPPPLSNENPATSCMGTQLSEALARVGRYLALHEDGSGSDDTIARINIIPGGKGELRRSDLRTILDSID